MALTKTKPADAVTSTAPAFESMDDNVVGTGPDVTVPSDDAQHAAAGVAATTAIAKAATGALTLGGKFKPAMTDFCDVITPEMREALGFGAFPRITVDSGGGFWVNKNEQKLGDIIKIVLISFNSRYIITPNEPDTNTEAAELVRYSDDGVTIESTGESVADYMKQLRDVHGYDPKKKLYFDMWGQLAHANGKDIAVEDREMYQIQLSPQSVTQFQGFQLSRGVKESQGLAKPMDLLVLTGARKSMQGNDFGIIKFSAE